MLILLNKKNKDIIKKDGMTPLYHLNNQVVSGKST